MYRNNNHNPAPRRFARGLRWIVGLLVVGNALAYMVRTQWGPIGGLFGFGGTAEAVGGAAKGAAGQSGIAGIPGIALLPEASSVVGQASPAEGNFKSGQLCWYISAGFAANAGDKQHAGMGDSPGQSGDERRLSTIQARLAALDIASQLVEVDVVDAVQYMVVVSNVAADATVDTLKWLLARNYNAFVVQLDEQVKAVALDIFTAEKEANQAAIAFAAAGLEVEVLSHVEHDRQARLMLSEVEYNKLARRVWSSLRRDFPGIGREKKYCQGIAPPA